MNSITESTPSMTLELAYGCDSDNESFRAARYALWNLTRLGWSDDDILLNAPHIHNNLVNALKAL